MPRFNEDNDLYSERVKMLLLCVCAFSIIMMISYPYGWLYACFPRPFYMFFYYLHYVYVGNGILTFFKPPTPEWGIHYLTLFIYAIFAYFGIDHFEHEKINKPIHKLSYVFVLTIITFYVPFELIYITLYDIFHNIPTVGYPAIWLFGWWKGPLKFITQSVITHDVGTSLFCIILMRIIIRDLRDYYDIEFRMNKKSLILFCMFLLSMFSWVIIPLYTDVPSWGTKFFPQTIYIKYGYYSDYNITWGPEGEDYGIVSEYWFPNDIIKYHNHISKLISVIFMFYTFLPRRVDNWKNLEK